MSVSLLLTIIVLLAKLRANGLGEKFEEGRSNPGGESENACDEPVVAVDSTSTDFEGITANLHDDTLTSANEEVDEAEGPVVEDSSENVERIVNDSGVNQVENAHHHEHIEYIREVARSSVQLISLHVKLIGFLILLTISISQSA